MFGAKWSVSLCNGVFFLPLRKLSLCLHLELKETGMFMECSVSQCHSNV